MGSAVGKLNIRSDREITDSSRHKHFALPRAFTDSGSDVYCNPLDILVLENTLPRMETGASLESDRLRHIPQGTSAPDGSGGSIEGRQHPVSGGLHETPLILF